MVLKQTLVPAILLLLATAVHADNRSYLVTYGYYTPEKGEVELEQWTDAFAGEPGGTAYRSRTEIEYGMTDRLATAIYLVNKRHVDGSWDYAETKLEIRYRLTQPGRRFWDAAGYLELVKPDASDDPYEIEAKGILSHEFPKFNLSVNLIAEREMMGDAETEWGYAIGLAPHRMGGTAYSVEVYGGEDAHYIMPGLWLSPGANRNFGIGVAAGLTHESDRLQIRTIYAHEF